MVLGLIVIKIYNHIEFSISYSVSRFLWLALYLSDAFIFVILIYNLTFSPSSNRFFNLKFPRKFFQGTFLDTKVGGSHFPSAFLLFHTLLSLNLYSAFTFNHNFTNFPSLLIPCLWNNFVEQLFIQVKINLYWREDI